MKLLKDNEYIRERSLVWYLQKYGIIITVFLIVIVVGAIATMNLDNSPSQNDEKTKVDKVYALEKKSPTDELKVTGVEDMICIECDKYGVDAELALAIAKLETGHFTSEAYTEGNNVGGLSIDEVPMEFKDLEQGVEAFVMNLHHNYIAEGLDTVDEIAEKYCPINKEQWAETVKALME